MLRLLCLLSLVDGLRLFRVWYCVQGGCLVLFGAFACAVCGIVFSLYRFVGSSLLSRRAADSIAAPHRTLLPFLAPSLPPSLCWSQLRRPLFRVLTIDPSCFALCLLG